MPIELINGAVQTQTQDTILAELNDAFIDEFGGDWELQDDDFTYRQNALLATREALLQGLAASAISSNDISRAIGRQLDYIGSLLGATRKAPTRSTIPATLFGSPGAAVGDRRVRYVLTDDLWRVPVGVVIGSNGRVSTTLVSEDTGPLFATEQGSTAWVIVDVLDSWSRLESTDDAQRGRDRELDPEYRERLILTRSAVGGTEPGIRAAIANTEGVTAFTVDNNRSPITNANGVPPWSIESVISGGTDDAVATTLYNTYGATSGFFGNSFARVFDPTDGVMTVVRWSRVVEYQVVGSFAFQLAGDTPLPIGAEDTVIAAIVDRINTNGAGINVDPGDLIAAGALALPPGVVEPDDSVGLVAFKGGVLSATPLVLTHRDNAFTIPLDQPATITGTAIAPFNLTAGETLRVTVDDEPEITFTINSSDYVAVSAATITELVTALSAQTTDALLVGSQSGALVLTSVSGGSASQIVVNATSSAALLTELGIVIATYYGSGPDITVTFTGP